MFLEETLLLERGWIIEETVATYIEYGKCEDKRVQTYKNQRQEFFLEKQVKNMWCNLFQEVWNWREKEARREEMTRVQYTKYKRKDTMGKRVQE